MNNFEKYKRKDIEKWEDRIYDYRAVRDGNAPQLEQGRYHLITAAADAQSHYDELALLVSGLRESVVVERLNPFDEDYEEVVSGYYQNTGAQKRLDETLPILVDVQTRKIVSNDPFDIAVLFETIWSNHPELRSNEAQAYANEIFTNLYVAGYRAGFAEEQIEYDAGYQTLFMQMDLLEAHLEGREQLVGEQLTDADLLLFAFLVRFDIQYVAAFRINRNLLRDFPNLDRYAKHLYQLPEFDSLVDFDAIKKYAFLKSVVTNPYGKLPLGLDMADWER